MISEKYFADLKEKIIFNSGCYLNDVRKLHVYIILDCQLQISGLSAHICYYTHKWNNFENYQNYGV